MSAADKIVAEAGVGALTSGWHAIDLAALLAGPVPQARPSLLTTDDGHALLYQGMTHLFFGQPESLKTWAALHACAEQIMCERRVLWIDTEDTPETLLARLLAFNLDPVQLGRHVQYVQLDYPCSTAGVSELLTQETSLVVIDAITGAMARMGLDQNSATDTAQFVAEVCQPCCAVGAAVVLVDHVPKSDTVTRFPIGSQHKLGAINGAAYHFSSKTPFGRGRNGAAMVRVTKDRQGGIRGVSDQYLIEAYSDGEAVQLRVTAVAPKGVAPAIFQPTRYMEQVSRALEMVGEAGLNKRALEARVKGRAERIREATEELLRLGYISHATQGSAHVYRSIRPYRIDEDRVGARPSSESVPTSSHDASWARPRPLQ